MNPFLDVVNVFNEYFNGDMEMVTTYIAKLDARL